MYNKRGFRREIIIRQCIEYKPINGSPMEKIKTIHFSKKNKIKYLKLEPDEVLK